mgnify:CR=1 FL=1
MGQRTQMLVLKTIHFKDGTKKHKNELYNFQWGFGRTMFMALMTALWKYSHPNISRYLNNMNTENHPFSYRTIDHPSGFNIDNEFDEGMIDSELSETEIDQFLVKLDNNDGYMIFHHDIYETDELYADTKYRVTMKQHVTFGEFDGYLMKQTPEQYMAQYSDFCDEDFVSAWKTFAQYWEVQTE